VAVYYITAPNYLILVSFLLERRMKKWQCLVCGFIYDEEQGLPEEGLAPGTAWADVPDDWLCPDCSVGKSDFEMEEIK